MAVVAGVGGPGDTLPAQPDPQQNALPTRPDF